MDNIKMGSFIREIRKEKGLTQKDVATHLNITDRAVSKWERGICAPDLALLEPLADILGVTITELIAGEKQTNDTNPKELEKIVKETISYSKQEISIKNKAANIKLVISIIAAVILGISFLLGFLWYNGFFHQIAKYPSPDGSITTTVYNCELGYNEPPQSGGFTLSQTGGTSGNNLGRTIYSNAIFRGLWWSPDSNYQVVSMYTEEGIYLSLGDYVCSSDCNLTLYLELSISDNEFFSDAPIMEDGDKDIDFDFVQWSNGNPSMMLIYFTYTDVNENFQEGYMWFDYESGETSGEIKIH